MIFGKRMVEIYHDMLEEYVHAVDTAIDATAGNGYDTEFLCRLVGDTGCVHAFDIQVQAIENTQARLEAAGLLERVRLHQTSHELMDMYISEGVAAFCFNLGYLPECSSGVITRASTTAAALEKALNALKIGGMGCVLCYYGHAGGAEELEIVDELLKSLPAKKYEVFRLENHNRAHQPPILYLIKRLR